MPDTQGPIGVFDSGYGGLTILKDLVERLPQYDYCYLGDNARAPYGSRSFETVYRYTLEAVEWFFAQGCSLVVLACNTASAKALRNIQQKDLPRLAPDKRVLGVIRPTAEIIGKLSRNGQMGILATQGTVASGSYLLEIEHFFPAAKVEQEACPLWVPLVENGEHLGEGADYFVHRHLENLLLRAPQTDTLLLGCTHYPLLLPKIREFLPPGIQVVSQGPIVAASLENYLQRHPEMAARLSTRGQLRFCTTDDAADFNARGALFFGKTLVSEQVQLGHL